MATEHSGPESKLDDRANEADERMQIVCTDCSFSWTMETDDERLPADVIIEHGRENGHTLQVH